MSKNYKTLPRGGYLVNTKSGDIQFGSPPETIKDTMIDSGVPEIFVITNKMFDWLKGISLAELEFPLYFNFFIKKRKTKIICSQNQEYRIKKLLSESLFGPQIINIEDDIHPSHSDVVIPKLKNEMNYFKSNLKFSDLAEFVIFDYENKAQINNIIIKHTDNYFSVIEDGKHITDVPLRFNYSAKYNLGKRLPEPFQPPRFGITCLGPSHGFDPSENTSGFILWINKNGIMIDPPVNSTEWLKDSNVNPKLIDSILLTHCHADHDAGTFQKILEEGKITIYTTNTIMESFTRKYSALSGEPENSLLKLFDFHPVYLEKPFFIHGAKFFVNYSFHSIPCVSFTVSYQNKKMVYSSDHLNEPKKYKELLDKEIFTEDRYNQLLDFPWDSDIIFHEAGVPPLHTRVDYLNSLSKKIQKKTVVYHISKKDFPKNTDLSLAKFGIENTITLQAKPFQFEKTYQIIGLLKHIDFFKNFPLEKIQDFLILSVEEKFNKGECIIRKGDDGNKFYIILEGNAALIDKNGNPILIFGMYEYFGEMSLITKNKRNANIIAKTDTTVLTMTQDKFFSFISGTHFEDTLKHLAKYRNLEVYKLLLETKFFQVLTNFQKTWIESMIKPLIIDGEGMIVSENNHIDGIYFIFDGEIHVTQKDKKITTLNKSNFIGTFREIDKEEPSKYSFSYNSKVTLYKINRQEAINFIQNNPGIVNKLDYDFE